MFAERGAQTGQPQRRPDRDMSGTLIESASSHEGPRFLALPRQRPLGVVIDVDDTVYDGTLWLLIENIEMPLHLENVLPLVQH